MYLQTFQHTVDLGFVSQVDEEDVQEQAVLELTFPFADKSVQFFEGLHDP